ncbi:MAG: hypothetical protein V4620_02620 [Bacteroidota bacterium]
MSGKYKRIIISTNNPAFYARLFVYMAYSTPSELDSAQSYTYNPAFHAGLLIFNSFGVGFSSEKQGILVPLELLFRDVLKMYLPYNSFFVVTFIIIPRETPKEFNLNNIG